jgi:dihydrofolate synthase/folylpolyglutamate synthase
MNTTDHYSRRDKAMAFLLSRIDYERAIAIPYHQQEFYLNRMRDLLARLGNPQEQLSIVHVAGTKGKGSTSAMIAAALSAAGHRSGLYTSPHVDRLEERLMVDNRPCSERTFVALLEQVRPIVEQMDAEGQQQTPPEPGPTYFEITTAMAMLHFATVETDIAVIEVGLGGRLDSTNVCQPLISVITSISFDHTQQLGNTLAEIAREKAGIIKPGIPVISGVIGEEARQVIADVAHQHRCRLMQLGVDFAYDYQPPRGLDQPGTLAHGKMDFENRMAGSGQRMKGIELGLVGRHQAANAAVALAVLTELSRQGWQLPEVDVRRGLANLRWPARVEIMARRPTVVIDAAHNVASVQSLLNTLEESFQAPRRLLVFATTQGKDVRGMLRLLLPHFEAVILTRYLNNPRAVSVEELDELTAELSPIPRFVCDNPSAAWHKACELTTADHLVCMTGSFFLAAEMRVEIARKPIERVEGEQSIVQRV